VKTMPEQRSTGSAAEAKQVQRRQTTAATGRGSKPRCGRTHAVGAGHGVKGGKWYSLIDKVYAPGTLALAWTKVQANKGAAGVDGQSVDRFAAKADEYLSELSTALREDSYRPQAVKRVEIPKGDGRTRPLGYPRSRTASSSRRSGL